MPSQNLYLHYPWCASKCRHCHFSSLPFAPSPSYPQNIAQEWTLRSSDPNPAFKTIYLGGGSPALLPASAWKQILAHFPLALAAEVTLEVNPELEQQLDWETLRECGINRAVLGVQSWHDNELALLGRLANTEIIRAAWEDLLRRGPANRGIDLIYALPEQTVERWSESLGMTLELEPQHISLYELDLAGRSWRPAQPDDEIISAMYGTAHEMLTAAGYLHYEISNFAQPGYFARHNCSVWAGEDYLGLGAGAHGRMGNRRYANAAFPDCWERMLAEGILPESSVWQMTPAETDVWDAILGLRTMWGISRDHWRRVANPEFESQLRAANLLVDEDRIKLTLQGWLISNRIFAELLDRNRIKPRL
jgi:oxygen-independent coproporphyrinogen III oxidase